MTKKLPIFIWKMIQQEMFDEEDVKDILYQGYVTKVLGENETSDHCDFNVKYKDFDEVYEVKLVEELKKQCAIILGKANQNSLKRLEYIHSL